MDYLKCDYSDDVENVFMAGSLARIRAENLLSALSKTLRGLQERSTLSPFLES
jgi:hypothetical protein